jgi:hypothetical protein
LAQKVTNIFKKIHQRVEKGLITLWTKIKTLGAGLLSKIKGKDKDKGKDKSLKDERTKEQKEKDLATGIKEGTTYLKGNKHLKKEKIDDTLKDISNKHQLVELKLVVDKHEETGKDLVHIHGKVNPEKDGEKVEVELGGELTKIEPAITVQPDFKCKESLDEAEFSEQLKLQEAGINKMTVSQWLKNRQDFLNRIKELKDKGVKNAQGRDPEGDKKAKEIRLRLIEEYELKLIRDEPSLKNNRDELNKRVWRFKSCYS